MCEGESQQEKQYSCWVRSGEMSLQIEERLVKDMKVAVVPAPPTPTQSSSVLLTPPRDVSFLQPRSGPRFLQVV